MMPRQTMRFGLLMLCTGLLIGFGIRGALSGLAAPAPVALGAQESTAAWAEQFQRLETQIGRIERAVTAEMSPSRPTPPAGAGTADRVAAALPPDAGLRQEMRRVLREEIRAFRVVESTEAVQRRAEATDPPPGPEPPERKQAYDESYEVVLAAVAAQRWTDEDAHTLRRTLGLLTDSQQDEILQLLIPAVNRGEITAETLGGLF